jgi:hypothetical protein
MADVVNFWDYARKPRTAVDIPAGDIVDFAAAASALTAEQEAYIMAHLDAELSKPCDSGDNDAQSLGNPA